MVDNTRTYREASGAIFCCSPQVPCCKLSVYWSLAFILEAEFIACFVSLCWVWGECISHRTHVAVSGIIDSRCYVCSTCTFVTLMYSIRCQKAVVLLANTESTLKYRTNTEQADEICDTAPSNWVSGSDELIQHRHCNKYT